MLQLRHGELLDDGGSTGSSNNDGLHRQSKSWTEEGVLSTSFTAIGKRDPYGQTRNVLDAITGVSVACFQQLSQELQVFLRSRECAGQRLPWVLLQRAFDGTPIHVFFGAFADVLSPLARYW